MNSNVAKKYPGQVGFGVPACTSLREIAESTATTNYPDDPYSDNEGELMKATSSKAKRKSDVAFSDAR
jgi:hypothetical protein